MKLQNKITKLLQEHSATKLLGEIINQVGWPQGLLAMSNVLVFKGNNYDKIGRRPWTKCAKTVHDMIDGVNVTQQTK